MKARLRALPVWPSYGGPDLSSADWSRIIETAAWCQSLDPTVFEQALREFVPDMERAAEASSRDYTADWSKPLILLRVMFAVSEDLDTGRFHPQGPLSFAAYIALPIHQSKQPPWTMAMPITWTADGPRLTYWRGGYSGPAYAAADEYRYLLKTFGFRKSAHSTREADGGGTNQSSARVVGADGDLERLRRALAEDDGGVRFRAVRELAYRADESVSARQLLVDVLLDHTTSPVLHFEAIRAVSVCGAEDMAAMLLRAYAAQGEPLDWTFDCVLIALGRLGKPAAAAAVPFLIAQREAAIDPREVAGIEVVLFGFGQNPEGGELTILDALRGGDEDRERLLFVMAATWAGRYLSRPVLDRVALLAREESRDAASALAALASWEATPTGFELDAVGAFVPETEEVALYRDLWLVQAGQDDAALRRMLAGPASMGGHAMAGFTLVVTPATMGRITRELGSPDDQVAAGAASVLLWAGRLSESVGKELLSVLESNRNEEVRQAAAEALAGVALPSIVPELIRCRDREASESVRETIETTIRIIRLDIEDGSTTETRGR